MTATLEQIQAQAHQAATAPYRELLIKLQLGEEVSGFDVERERRRAGIGEAQHVENVRALEARHTAHLDIIRAAEAAGRIPSIEQELAAAGAKRREAQRLLAEAQAEMDEAVGRRAAIERSIEGYLKAGREARALLRQAYDPCIDFSISELRQETARIAAELGEKSLTAVARTALIERSNLIPDELSKLEARKLDWKAFKLQRG
jgi:hypothetical protein